MASRVFYSAQYYTQHCTRQTLEQFGALYMHNHNNKYPAELGLEPGTSRLQTPVDTNEPSGPATYCCSWGRSKEEKFIFGLFLEGVVLRQRN